MIKKIAYIISIFFISLNSFAFNNDSLIIKYANTIKADELKKHLYTIASSDFEGRETGMEGQRKSAEYLINSFRQSGLQPGNNGSYLQKFPLISNIPEGVKLELNNKSYSVLNDFSYFITNFNDTVISKQEIIFLGYGINDSLYDDYKNIDVNNKLILVLDGEPKKGDKFLLSGNEEPSEWSINFRKKVNTSHEKGASGIMIIKNILSDNVKHLVDKNRMKLDLENKTSKSLYSFFITKDLGNSLLSLSNTNTDAVESEINNTGKTINHTIQAKIKIELKSAIRKFDSDNVLAFIEGSDLKSEILVLTAHYDHLGIKDGEVFNGADDDGSGTVSLLEIAEAFSKAKKEGNGPRRSILFMPFSGEEKGLLGSEYYSQNPVYSFKNTIANLNIDMIGRVDEAHLNEKDFVYIIGSDKLSKELHKINESANDNFTKLKLDYTYNKPNDPNRFYYRSDHYNFAKHNVPIIFYFNGTHEDYHKTTDTPEKIDYNLLEKRAKLVFFTAWELVNRKERIKVDYVKSSKTDN